MLQSEGVVPFGVRVMIWCNRISGFWLPIPASPWRRLLLLAFESLVLIANALSFLAHIVRIHTDKIDFIVYMLGIASLMKYAYIVCASTFLLLYKKQVEQIFKDAQNLLKNRQFYYYQMSVLNRTSKRLIVYLSLPILLFFVIQMFLATNSARILRLSKMPNVTSEEDKFVESILRNDGTTLDYSLIILTFTTNVLTQFKAIALDAMFLGLLSFVSEQLGVLKITLHEAILVGPSPSYKRTDLDAWLNFQYRLARLTGKINATWSFLVVVLFFCTALTLCSLSYSAVKLSPLGIVTYVIIAHGLISVLPLFLYCHAGQNLRTQGEALAEMAFRGPWLHMKPALMPGVLLLALDCSRSFVARGGPFFTLSLEFFASVVGAVLTYLVVLLQMK
ncbi:Odorant receptor 25 [Ephemera danica]|nr:Odorant receptor 25 [Ephemera danica]